MSEFLRTVTAYVPLSLARATLAAERPTPPTAPVINRHRAAVLYADISGFTPLTEALGQKGAEGPEELTRLLNRYLGWMIAFIEAEGGEIVKFGGDSLTAVFTAIDEPLSSATRRAVQAANTMQSAMEEFGIVESSAGLVNLTMKLGIGAGELLRTQVGGVESRWEYIIAGEALFEATLAERNAAQGEIVLGPNANAIVTSHQLPPRLLKPLQLNTVQDPAAAAAVLRCYVPRPILAWLDKGLHGWLATLRPMSVLFVGLGSLDYGQDGTIERLHHFIRAAQKLIYHYQGSVPRLSVDDKGTVLLVLFGAPPYSHEDDSERAVRCALQLQALAQAQKFEIAIGVTTGRVFAGPVGGFSRLEYTVMGDAVNLAARLMTAAGPGQICCNYETYRTTYGQLSYDRLPPLTVKGKVEPVRVYRPVASVPPEQQLEYLEQSKMPFLVGRRQEMQQLLACLNAVQAGQNQTVIIEGEAGIGKTQIVREMMQSLRASGFAAVLGTGRSIEQETPYRAWRDILAAHFETTDQAALLEKIRAKLDQVFPWQPDDLLRLKKLLYPPATPVPSSQAIDWPQHQQRLALLLLALLRPSRSDRPLALIFENAQWLDVQSWNLNVEIIKQLTNHPASLLLVLVMRPFEGNRTRLKAGTLAKVSRVTHLRIDSLPVDEVLALVVAPIGLTSNELPEAVVDLIRSRAEGNPFFAEEIFYSLHQNGFITFRAMQNKTRCLVSDDFGRAAQTLPATIQAIILSRIDQLPPEKQLLLKIAAVIGQVFTYAAVRDTLQTYVQITEQDLKNYLEDLIYLGLISLESLEPEPAYRFRHLIIREVTYQTLLFDRRRQLHRTVAEWYEKTYSATASHRQLAGHNSETATPQLLVTRSLPPASTPLAPYYSLLVYHWHQAEDQLKEQHYAALVGQQAVAEYANAEAIGYLSRALDLTPEDKLLDRYHLLLERETVFHRRGDRERQRLDLHSLAAVAQKLNSLKAKAKTALRLGRFAEVTADYAAAVNAARSAIEAAKQARYSDLVCQGYLIWVKALIRQGNYQDARYLLERIRAMAKFEIQPATEAEILQIQALLAGVQGYFTDAHDLAQQSLAMIENRDHPTLQACGLTLAGESQIELGSYQAAAACLDQAILLFYMVGDKQGETKPLHQLGRLHLCQGDYLAARDYFEYVLDITKDVDDQVAMVNSLIELSMVYSHWGDYTIAQGYLGQALGTCKKIGYLAGEANALSKLGRIYFDQSRYETTRRYCILALAIQEQLGALAGEYYTQTYLGHALLALDDLPGALAAYQRVLHLQRETGWYPPAIPAKIGLAAVYWRQDAAEQARRFAEESYAWLEAHGEAGLDHPCWAYLTLYKILAAADAESSSGAVRAQQLLGRAYALLQSQANQLKHKKLRRKFLERIDVNREIVALKEKQGPPPVIPVEDKNKTKEKFQD